MLQGEITNKALATLLSLASQAPEDVEGLLFGQACTRSVSFASDHGHDHGCNDVTLDSGPCALVESCRMVGALWSIAAPGSDISTKSESLIDNQMQNGLRLLGWFSISACPNKDTRGMAARPTMREARLHKVIAQQIAKQSSAIGDGASVPVLGSMFQVHRDAGELGTFAVDSTWMAGIEMLPVPVKVHNIGATALRPSSGNSTKAGECGPSLFPWALPQRGASLLKGIDEELFSTASRKLAEQIPQLLSCPMDTERQVEKEQKECLEVKARFYKAEAENRSANLALALQDQDRRRQLKEQRRQRKEEQKKQEEQRRNQMKAVEMQQIEEERKRRQKEADIEEERKRRQVEADEKDAWRLQQEFDQQDELMRSQPLQHRAMAHPPPPSAQLPSPKQAPHQSTSVTQLSSRHTGASRFCPKGHRLEAFDSKTSHCMKCERRTVKPRYRCQTCSYNICERCFTTASKEPHLTFMAKPGGLGLKLDDTNADKIGLVQRVVSGSQAADHGVEVGMYCKIVNIWPYTAKLLDEQMYGEENYQLTFERIQAPISTDCCSTEEEDCGQIPAGPRPVRERSRSRDRFSHGLNPTGVTDAHRRSLVVACNIGSSSVQMDMPMSEQQPDLSRPSPPRKSQATSASSGDAKNTSGVGRASSRASKLPKANASAACNRGKIFTRPVD